MIGTIGLHVSFTEFKQLPDSKNVGYCLWRLKQVVLKVKKIHVRVKNWFLNGALL
jgi:hypothetical protein